MKQILCGLLIVSMIMLHLNIEVIIVLMLDRIVSELWMETEKISINFLKLIL